MQGKIVLIQFPFDDLSSSKVRPAYCLTKAIGNYQHIIFALITSRIPSIPLTTDILFQPQILTSHSAVFKSHQRSVLTI